MRVPCTRGLGGSASTANSSDLGQVPGPADGKGGFQAFDLTTLL